MTGEFVRTLGPEGPGSTFAHKPYHVAMTHDAAFCVETRMATKVDEQEKEKFPGRIHAINPYNGAKLRPAFQPPFAVSHKGHPTLTGLGCFHDSLWVSTSFGIVLRLPRKPPESDGKVVPIS